MRARPGRPSPSWYGLAMRRTTHIAIALAAGALLAAAGTVAWRDTFTVRLTGVEVPVPGLTREVRVLHASDLHGASFGPGQSRIAAALAGRRFDAAIINGDHIPSPDAGFEPVLELLGVLQDHADMVFVTRGNHDTTEVLDELAEHGAIVVEPGDAAISFATDAGRLVAIPALDASDIPADTDLSLALGHYPLTADALISAADTLPGTALFCFGHAHGGQIRLPVVGALWAPGEVQGDGRPTPRIRTQNFFPELRGRHISGLTRVGTAYRHISTGLGTQAIRLRFRASAEMTTITLVPK